MAEQTEQTDGTRLWQLERLLARLNEWRADPSSIRWQPVQKLIDELEHER